MLFLEPGVRRERCCSAAGGRPLAIVLDHQHLVTTRPHSSIPSNRPRSPLVLLLIPFRACRRPPFLCALWDGATLFVILPVTTPLTSHEGLYRILPSHLRETGPSSHKFFFCPWAYGLRAQGPGLNTWLVSLELLSYPPTPAWCPGWIFTVFCRSRI